MRPNIGGYNRLLPAFSPTNSIICGNSIKEKYKYNYRSHIARQLMDFQIVFVRRTTNGWPTEMVEHLRPQRDPKETQKRPKIVKQKTTAFNAFRPKFVSIY